MSKLVKVGEVEIESLINKNFSVEFLRKIYDVYSNDCMSIVEKTIQFDRLFTTEFGDRKDYRRIGEGTNRFVCLLDNHIIKVAYNYLAYIDNMNELAMAKKIPNELARAYETNGIILVSEYVTVMDKEDFLESQTQITFILTKLESQPNIYNKEKGLQYILGDMGMSDKNYGNWGRRMNGDIVVLDYGYLYEMSYTTWRDIAKCPVCGSSLTYSKDYSELHCASETCSCKVKYTTLRNNLGYANIIDNINKNINTGKYIKFDKKGKIHVDIMEKVNDAVMEEEPFILPDEVSMKLDRSLSTFFDISTMIQNIGFIRVDKIDEMRYELYEEKDCFDEMLFPFILGVLTVTEQDIESYLNDFNKIYTERYNYLYNILEKEVEKDDNLDDLNDYDLDDHDNGFEVNSSISTNTSDISFVDRLGNKDENRVVTSLDDMLSAELGNDFSDLFMADENSEMLDKFSDDEEEYSLEYILSMISNEQVDNTVEEEEELDDDVDVEELLQERFSNLKLSLTNMLSSFIDSEDADFIDGDVYRTYLNGDCIDPEYSPEVNASNILGGWKPDEFAFPLYRHMLHMFEYDTERVDEEYEATYIVGQDLTVPEDIYNKVENRSIVVDQILNRFEDNKPSRHIVINYIGVELDRYYEALDLYYEQKQDEQSSVDINDPRYYFEQTKISTEITKEIQEAKENLTDDLLDESLRLSDMLKDNKIVYYYDTEYLYSNTQLNIKDIIGDIRCLDRAGNVRDDITDQILNKYYVYHGTILADETIDAFKYGNSLVVDSGNELHYRTRKPVLKAKLVPKDSNEDIYKPQVFTREKYTRIVIEQRFETIFRDNAEEQTKLNDLLLDLNRRGLYFHQSKKYRYVVKTSRDNLRYLLTEQEVELLNEYQDILGLAQIKDTTKAFAKSVVDYIKADKVLAKDTVKFLNDLAMYGITEALAERSFVINVLEINGAMTRLEYLDSLR